MGGLAKILREKSSIVQGDQDGPRHIQLPEEILLDLPVAKYGLGGDVEGGRDEGVGGMSNDGNQSNGTESSVSSDSPHDGTARGGDWGGDPGGWSTDNISNPGFSDGSAYDGFGGSNGDGGYNGSGVGEGNFSDFGGWNSNGRMTSDVSYGSGLGSFTDPGGWSVDNINANGWGADDFESGDAYGGYGSGGDIYGGYQDNEFGANTAFGSFGGLGGAFGAYTPDGALTGPQASEVDFAGTSGIGTAPLQGSLQDFAPGPQQTMPGMIDPETALTDLATNIAPAPVTFTPDDYELSFQEEEDGLPLVDIQQPPDIVSRLTDWDLRSPTSLVHPDRRAGFAVATTEQLNNINRGKTLGAPEVGVLAARAAIGYGPQGWERRGIDRDTMYGQAIAPSQFSGINRAGKARNADLNKVEAWEQRNPDLANRVKATVEDVIQGDLVPSTMGALSFSTPGKSRISGNDRSMGTFAGHAFGNYSGRAREAYNDRVNPDQVSPDDNPAFNTPAKAPGPQSWNAEFNPAEVDLADATPGFTGPVRDSMSLAGLPASPTERDWGFSDMLGLSAQAKDFTDQVPGLPNQAAYDGMPVSVDTLAAERAAMGPVNGVKVSEEAAPGISWGDIGSMLATGFGNMFTTEQPAIAYETPGPIEEQEERTRAAQRSVPSFVDFNDIVEDSFPSIPIQDTDFSLRAGNRGVMPGTASGLVGSGPSFGARGPGMPGFESMGLPSGRPGSRMTVDPRIDTNRREGPIETDAPPAGALVAGGGVYGTAPDKKSPSTGSARPSGSRSAPKGTAVATNEVYGPVMPGMIPGTDRYPTSGVIAQPSTAFHEKVAERAGGALAGMGLGAIHPGLSLANTLSGLFGGPSTGGLFANSTPGMDLSRGRFDNWDDGGREQERPRTSQVAAKDDKKDDKKKDKKEPERWTPPDYGDDYASLYDRRYLGPDDDPRSYGYRRERKYFTAAQGGRVNPGEPSRSGLSRARSKRTA